MLGLKRAPMKEKCPYGRPPEIEEISEGDWTINGKPRLKADPGCQIIQMDIDACATCPLADPEPEEPPSAFLQYLVHVEGLQAVGAQFAFDSLPMIEWNGLQLLKRKRDEKSMRDLKQK